MLVATTLKLNPFNTFCNNVCIHLTLLQEFVQDSIWIGVDDACLVSEMYASIRSYCLIRGFETILFDR